MSGVKLYIATSKIWAHFFANIQRLAENEDCIAENKEIGRALYLTAEGFLPELVLYDKGDRPIIWRPVRSQDECNTAATYLIIRYLVNGDVQEESDTTNNNCDKPKVIDLPSAKGYDEEEGRDVEIEDIDPDPDEEEQMMMDTIYEREDALEKAVGDCLAVILLEEDCNAVKEGYGNLIQEVVDDLTEYLYTHHQISVYRPTILVDKETDEEIFAEYPYGWNDEFGGTE